MKHRQQVRKGKQVKNMNRLTSNKPVEEMGMYELAHNCCCYENGNAVYRDFEMEMDAREFARNLMVTLTDDELSLDDDEFDEEVLENLQYDQFSDVRGLIALFYRNLWAMADLRERLKEYEDAEEQKGGWILCSERLPEPGKRYLVSGVWKDKDFEKHSVYDAVYGTDGLWHSHNYEPVSYEVIAWQPLPAPYKEPAAVQKTHKK